MAKRKHILHFMILMFLLPVLAFAQDTKFHFRGSNWGDTPELVRQKETGQFIRDTTQGAVSLSIFRIPFLDEEVTAVYRFIGNKLFHVTMSFAAGGRNCAALAKRYEDAKAQLQTEFGMASATQGESGDACNKSVTWEPTGTKVVLSLTTASRRSDLQVAYESKALSELSTRVTYTEQVK